MSQHKAPKYRVTTAVKLTSPPPFDIIEATEIRLAQHVRSAEQRAEMLVEAFDAKDWHSVVDMARLIVDVGRLLLEEAATRTVLEGLEQGRYLPVVSAGDLQGIPSGAPPGESGTSV